MYFAITMPAVNNDINLLFPLINSQLHGLANTFNALCVP